MTRAQFNKKFPDWLKNRRAQLGLTQGELARKVGVTQDWISHFECGRRVPDAFLFNQFNQFLGGF